MPGALILDGHSRAAVEAVQSLGRAGIPVTVSAAEADCSAFASRYPVDRLLQPDTVPVAGFIQWLRALDARQRFELLIPSTEASLLALQSLAEDDPLRRRAVLPSQQDMAIALDKTRTCALASRLAIHLPASRVIDHVTQIGSAAALPTVLKPSHSKRIEQGELKGFEPAIVSDAQARRAILGEWVPRMAVIEQEYIGGWGVGVEMLYRNGQRVWHLAHERLHEWPLTGGGSSYRRAIDPPPELLDAATRLMDALDWHGVAMVEFKRAPDGRFVLMEINPRLWGSLALSIDAGVDFPIGLWQLATGRMPAPQPRYRVGMRTRHLVNDTLLWQRGNLLADRSNPLLLLRPRLPSLLGPLRALIGGERWDHFQWSDLGPFVNDIRKAGLLARQVLAERNQTRHLGRRWQQERDRFAAIADNVARERRAPRLMFVCQANICRSPFAALLAAQRLPGCTIESSALSDRPGRGTPDNVADDAGRFNLDMRAHRSNTLTLEHGRHADAVFVMEPHQLQAVRARFPELASRTFLLGLFAQSPSARIDDPNFLGSAEVRRINDQIASALDGLKALLVDNPLVRQVIGEGSAIAARVDARNAA